MSTPPAETMTREQVDQFVERLAHPWVCQYGASQPDSVSADPMVVKLALVLGLAAGVIGVRRLLRDAAPRPRWNLLILTIIWAAIALIPTAMLVHGLDHGDFSSRRLGKVRLMCEPGAYWTVATFAYVATWGMWVYCGSFLVRLFRKGTGREELV